MSYQFSTTTALSDETYLESFIESISSSLPNELRRNLEHLRDLDKTSTQLMERWRDVQDDCLKKTEVALVDGFREDAERALLKKAESGDGADDDDDSSTESRRRYAKKKRKKPSKPAPSSSKPACSKCRARKVRCDGTQPMCLLQFDSSSEEEEDDESDDGSNDKGDEEERSKKQKVESIEDTPHKNDDKKHSIAASPPSITPEDITTYLQNRPPPTSSEIQTILHSHHPNYPSQRSEIDKLYRELKQYSNEKIETAKQLQSMVDMVLGRLDRDLETFEKELGIVNVNSSSNVGDHHIHHHHHHESGHGVVGNVDGGVMRPGVGIGGTGAVGGNNFGYAVHQQHNQPLHPAGSGGGAGRGIHHGLQRKNSQSGAPRSRSSSAVAAIPTTTASVPKNTNRLQRSSATAAAVAAALVPRPATSATTQRQPHPPHPPPSSTYTSTTTTTLRGTLPPPPKSVQTTNLAAIQVTPNSPDWILAKILSHDKSTKTYTLSDEDFQSNQIYKIPEKQTVVLKGTEKNKWVRGDVVYAVYPDTTSFYHATVSTPPFNGFVMVQFKDDWDVNGVTHEKAVLMAHVMKVPPGGK